MNQTNSNDKINEEFERAYDKTITYLANRDYFELELKNKLRQKNFSENSIEYAISKLKKNRYIDDYKYAIEYAKSYLQKEGSLKVRSRLMERGLSSEKASFVISDIGIDEEEVAKKILLRKIENMKNSDISERKTWEKLARHLKGKGFSDQTVIKVLSNL